MWTASPTRSATRRRPVFRLEALEDRTALSVLTVTSAADSGPGTLRADIAAAAPGDTITFDPHLAGKTITLTSGELAVGKDLTILGLGANKLTVSGGGTSRVFDVAAGAHVAVSGLTIAGGFADQGGGVLNAGTLTLQNDTVSGNQAVGDSAFSGVGGGVFNLPGATLGVVHSKFVNNQVVGGPGIGFGGGIFNLGTATVSASTFTGNVAAGGVNAYGAGGAINCQNGAAMTVTDSTFTGNQAVGGVTDATNGGAIDSEVNTTLTIVDSTFVNNVAADGATADPFAFSAGGALLTYLSNVTVTGCTFQGNEAVSTGFAVSGGYEAQLSQATVSNTAFTANEALGVAGGSSGAGAVRNIRGSVALSGCTLAFNVARGGDGADGVHFFGQSNGGAVLNERGPMTVTGCTFLGNLARGGDGGNNSAAPTPDSAFVGGALGGGIFNLFSSTLTVSDSTFIGNQAVAGASAAGPGPGAYGGAINNDVSSSMTAANSVFVGNGAFAGAGGAGAQGGTALGGAISNQFDSTASLTGCLLAANVAAGGAGGAGAVGGTAYGGGVLSGHPVGFPGRPDASSLTLDGTVLAGNAALGGAGGAGANGGGGLGGGVYLATGTACFQNSAVVGNLAAGGAAGSGGGTAGKGIGGGIYIAPGVTAGATKSHIAGNLATTSDDDVFGTLNPTC